MQAEPLVCQRATAEEHEQHCSLHYPAASDDDGQPPVDGHPAGGCDTACGAFSPQQYLGSLSTSVLGRVLLTAAATASTQVVVQENVAKLPDGLVFVADKQFGGKGGQRLAYAGK